MAHRFGLYDVDSRELDESGRNLAFRPRVGPIVPQLERLYTLAEEEHYPLVFTTCCSGRMASPGRLPNTGFVPMNVTEACWRAALPKCRRFYLAKPAFGHPNLNRACRAFDIFQHNANAPHLFRELDVGTWVVFGNGFDLCVGSAARGLLQAGLKVVVLEDVRVSSADATPQSELQTLHTLREQGARLMTLDSFLSLTAHP